MIKYILNRIGFAIITLLTASTLLFILLQLMPGKPYDNKIDLAARQKIEDKYGLDEPMPLQYASFIIGVMGFDNDIDDGGFTRIEYKVMPQFGDRWRKQKNAVSDVLIKQYPISIRVGMQALAIGTVVGLVLGILCALFRGKWVDHLLTILAIIGVSVPSFVFASLLQYMLGFQMDLFPLTYEKHDPFFSSLLPSVALSLFVIASLTRYMRTELVEVLGSEYILLAKAKGLPQWKVILKHAIRNAMIPVITILGPLALAILGGSMVVESIFTIPGMGGELVDSINSYDNPMILGITFFYSLFYIIVILLVDISYGLIDPRVRVQGGGS